MFRGVMGQLEQGLVCAGAVVRLTVFASCRVGVMCSNGSIWLDVTVLVLGSVLG